MDKKTFKTAFKVCAPVILGYIPSGFAFGLMITTAGFNIITAVIMSLVIYAGAGQYLAVGFFTANISIIQMAVMTFLINSKHMFYGLSLLEDFKNTKKLKPYLIFALTDETYALLTGTTADKNINKKKYMFYVSLINHITWVIGSALGALLGSVLDFNTTGIDFAMTALFFVIVIEQIKNFKTKLPFLIGIISSIIALTFFGKQNMLLGGSVLSVIILLVLRRKIEENDNK